MHLVTTTTVLSVYCRSVPPFCLVISRPCHRATIKPCHLSRQSTLPYATNMPEPCCRNSWCDIVTLLCDCATFMPPGAPPCNGAAVPPPYRHDTSTYLSTPTHLTAVNHISYYCLKQFHHMVYYEISQ